MTRLENRLFAPVDISWLVLFRVVFGSVMLFEVYRYFSHGWVDANYSPTDFHFTYFGFDWVKPWPGTGMRYHFAILGLAAACIAAGFCYRIMAVIFFLGFTHVFLLEATRYLNHFYLICLISFVMIFMPAARAWSVDSWMRPAMKSNAVPAWTLWLMRAMIGIPYFFGGIAKLNSDWLHGEPMRMWLAYRAHMPVIGPYVHEEWMVYFFTMGGLLLDLFIVPCLLWKRTRVPAFLAAAAFHLFNSQLFRIGIFPWLMLAATMIFFPPDTPRRILAFFKILPREPVTLELAPTAPARRRVIMALLAIFLGVQVLMPFRHWAYPGDVHWTEEGHRFSWHMKLRSKSGDAIFLLRDPASGQTWTVDPWTELRQSVCEKMTTHPDMVVQYAHHLAEQKRGEGYRDIEVRASTMVSLNGRRPQPLVDPQVNLAAVKRTLRHAEWIVPLTVRLQERDTTAESSDTPRGD